MIRQRAIAVFVIALLVFQSGCAQSTHRFEPTKRQTVAEGQRKSIVPGANKPYSGMDCLKLMEYQLAYCDATQSCTALQYSQIKRAIRRLDKHFRSQCAYAPEQIRGVFRDLRRGR